MDDGQLLLEHVEALTGGREAQPVLVMLELIPAGAQAELHSTAAHLGHDGVVRELAQAGAPLDHINNLGWTALIEAVILGDGGPRHTETVRALVEAGANPGIPDPNGVTSLQHAKSRNYRTIASILRQVQRR